MTLYIVLFYLGICMALGLLAIAYFYYTAAREEDPQEDFDYWRDIRPLAKLLCRLDGGKSEANYGQALEQLKNMAQIERLKPGSLDKIKEYSKMVEMPEESPDVKP